MPVEFTINPWGFTGLLAVLTAWSLALFLHRSAVQDRLTRLFATVLVVEGLVLITASAGLVMLFDLQVSPLKYYWAHHVADCVMFVLYPSFIAHALPQPFLAPLRSRWAIPVLAVIVTPALVLRAFSDFWLIALMLGVMFISAFLLALHAVFLARTSLGRRRAQLFALAFGIRDVAWGIVYTSGFFGWLRSTDAISMAREQLYVGSTLVYIPIVAYGILSVRLLDIQVEVRRGVQRGTLAAVFVAIFFLISEGSASLLSEQFGSAAGLLGATIIVLLLSPLHRVTEWLSGQIVPVDESAEYKAYRKLQMYAAAFEDAQSHGEIGPSQRSLLDKLRDSLEMSDADAQRVEADLLGTARS